MASDVGTDSTEGLGYGAVGCPAESFDYPDWLYCDIHIGLEF